MTVSRAEVDALLMLLNAQFAMSLDSPRLVSQVQGVAMSEGYRLINPRVEWAPSGDASVGPVRVLIVDDVVELVIG